MLEHGYDTNVEILCFVKA